MKLKSLATSLLGLGAGLTRRACGIKPLRLHPKFAWLNYACPILDRTRNPRPGTVSPPANPPKLKLRKRRRPAPKNRNPKP